LCPALPQKWQEAALLIHKINAIKFGEFVLTSGRISPYYVDLRLVPSYPEVFNKLADLCVDLIKQEIGEPIDKIAGVPITGIPLATLVSFKLNSPLIFVRKEKKTHGRMRMVEGVLEAEDEVLLVDDLATTGGSIKDAADAIRDEGGIVKHAIVVLDRGEGAREVLGADGIHLHAGMGLVDVMKFLRANNLIDGENYSQVTQV
jgi:orotate phosphoribosyltransferase